MECVHSSGIGVDDARNGLWKPWREISNCAGATEPGAESSFGERNRIGPCIRRGTEAPRRPFVHIPSAPVGLARIRLTRSTTEGKDHILRYESAKITSFFRMRTVL